MYKKLTQQEFIQKAKLVHGDKYNYSKILYINARTKIEIICKLHESFFQTPNNHLQDHGCPKCSGNLISNTYEFIQKANLIHDNFYNYSKTNYINSQTKVCILCHEHGNFYQTPNAHLNGKGCAKCYSKTLNDFIQKANLIHNNFYNYSKSEYKNSKTILCIICPNHGEFWQQPNNHLIGKGCPKCQRSKGEEVIENWLKENNIQYETQKRFKDCKNIKPLPFDFFLPNHNICIEFDGEQHFKPSYFGGKESGIEKYNRTKISDNIKNKYCQIYNISLIRIPYYNLNKIKTTLKKYLNL